MLTYGFYNSKNHDRRYNALQMSSIFDGIIKDGVFMSIGNHFNVTANGTNMAITIGTGRAWFNHTWTLNDAPMVLSLQPSNLVLGRIDAVVLEVNNEVTVRANSIKIKTGTASSNPQKPSMTNTQTIHQYPLAFITVAAGVTLINQADVENAVGITPTPFITGVLETINIDTLIQQWKDQWRVFYERQTKEITDANIYWNNKWKVDYNAQIQEMKESNEFWKLQWADNYAAFDQDLKATFAMWTALWKEFYETQTIDIESTNARWKQEWFQFYTEKNEQIIAAIEEWDKELEKYFQDSVVEMNTVSDGWKAQWREWYDSYTQASHNEWSVWIEQQKQDFTSWLAEMKGMLNSDVGALLADYILEQQKQIEYLNNQFYRLEHERGVFTKLIDDYGREIVDSDGEPITGALYFQVVE